MKRAGRARRSLIVSLCPTGRRVVDVGADHGHVAHATGAIAVEKEPHRRGRPDVPWVVCDGLSGLRDPDVAIIAGMGAKTILGILDRGPQPRTLVVHAPDDPPALRQGLAARGWRIDAEGLAPEGNRWAEVIRAEPGVEPATGLTLAYGPKLLTSDDPHLRDHLTHHHSYWASIARRTEGAAPAKHALAIAHVSFLADRLSRLG